MDQSGFLQNKFLKYNLWKLCNTIDILGDKHIPALFCFIDDEKAFDRVEWQFMKSVAADQDRRPVIVLVGFDIPGPVHSCLSTGVDFKGYMIDSKGPEKMSPISNPLNIIIKTLAIAVHASPGIKDIYTPPREHNIVLYANNVVSSARSSKIHDSYKGSWVYFWKLLDTRLIIKTLLSWIFA